MNNTVICYEYTDKTRHMPVIAPMAYGLIYELNKKIEEAKRLVDTRVAEPVSISEKYSLSIQEAAEYYGIGEKRLRSFLADHWNESFVLEIGTHTRIKRRLFEEYLDQMAAV